MIAAVTAVVSIKNVGAVVDIAVLVSPDVDPDVGVPKEAVEAPAEEPEAVPVDVPPAAVDN